MVRRRQVEFVKPGLVRRDGFGSFQAVVITAAEDVCGNHQLVAAHFFLARDFVGVDVDQFDDPVGIGAAGGCDHVSDGLSADFDGLAQFIRNKGQHVRPPGGFALVVHQPL